MQSVPTFESMLINSGINVLNYRLDISKDEQILRLAARQNSPLKKWKSSPIESILTCHARSELWPFLAW